MSNLYNSPDFEKNKILSIHIFFFAALYKIYLSATSHQSFKNVYKVPLNYNYVKKSFVK